MTGFTGLTDAVYTLDAWMTYEDGSSGSLAFAGPLAFATQSGFERAVGGFMQFDAADFGADAEFPQSEQLFLDSAVHEVAHAVGFGTMFADNDLTDASGNNYIGANALAAFNTTNGTSLSSILLENGGGHWNECWIAGLDGAACSPEDGSPISGLYNDPELMTPYAVDDPATVSAATIAAFQDLGYLTIDPFTAVSIPLAADIGTTPSPVPLPASGLLLLGALGFVPALRRKSKRA
ncbi:leishmanolysin-related zinc metalloendopeptidase [Pseudorhodobacter aquimaris]|uniref:leishmanolysin-related zinc metalloendopeptidase n=1 Tax=Pseudorhodobacter aquimaris TaxID=687412 RepID=UPI0012ED4B55|nr:leishmanolysin-related zinc metalloendopeptidase [Pseudorhodobacter aquimaris]